MIDNNIFTFDIQHNADAIKKAIQKSRALLEQYQKATQDTCVTLDTATVVNDLDEAALRCGNIVYMSKCMESSAVEANVTSTGNCLRILFEKANKESKQVVCILGPMFTEANITDGYVRRVKNVDSLFQNTVLRIYIFKDTQAPWPSLTYIDENHVLFTYNDSLDVRGIFEQIKNEASLIYCHSIHRFDEIFFEHLSKPLILDLHGAVPEEMLYLTEDEEKAALYNKVEHKVVAKASTIIAVTNAMVEHLKNKYPIETQHTDFLVMPIFDIDLKLERIPEEKTRVNSTGSTPCAIYAGGTQRWQLFDEMLDAIEAQPNSYTYKLFIPEPSSFDERWNTRIKPDHLEIATKTPQELKREYELSDFGFILRDCSIVNQVACPTKLIEYLAYGIIPIVKSPHIGDFEDDGFAYIRLSDFITNKLPDRYEQIQMIKTNFRVAQLQRQRFYEGEKKLRYRFSQLSQKRKKYFFKHSRD